MALHIIQIPENKAGLGRHTRRFTMDKNKLIRSNVQTTEMKFQIKIYFDTTRLKMSIVFKKTFDLIFGKVLIFEQFRKISVLIIKDKRTCFI